MPELPATCTKRHRNTKVLELAELGCARRPVSRVLSREATGLRPAMRGFVPVSVRVATIYLAPRCREGRAANPGTGRAPIVPLFGLAPDGVCLAPDIATGAVSSYLAFSPLPRFCNRGGVFLWHFPSGRPAPPLAGILP